MKKWRSIMFLLLLAGLATGCFSKEKEKTTVQPQPVVQQEKNEPSNSAKGVEPKEEKGQTTKPVVPTNPASATVSPAPKVETSITTPKPAAPGATVDQIASKYKQELNSLRGYYSGQLQAIYSGAIADAKSNSFSKKEIYAKYAKKALAIQEESQAKVNQVLARMKEELLAHQLPTDKIQVFRNTYYSEINEAKSRAMAQVKKALGM